MHITIHRPAQAQLTIRCDDGQVVDMKVTREVAYCFPQMWALVHFHNHKVEAIKLLRTRIPYSLYDSKRLTDALGEMSYAAFCSFFDDLNSVLKNGG